MSGERIVIKQVQWSRNQVKPQQAANVNQEAKPPQPPRMDNQVNPSVDSVTPPAQSVKPKPQVNNSRSNVDSVVTMPNELYERLGLTMPKWLLWILTFVLGIILSGLLVSTLALWTPLWSNLDRTKFIFIGAV